MIPLQFFQAPVFLKRGTYVPFCFPVRTVIVQSLRQ